MQVLQEELGAIDEAVFQAAAGFGGGVGGSQSICGAITGAALAMGSHFGRQGLDRAERRQQVRPRVRQLCRQFKGQFEFVDCRELTACDFDDDQAHQRFIDAGLREAKCLRYVDWVIGRVLADLKGAKS